MGVFTNIQRLLDSKLKTVDSSPFISWPNTDIRPGNAQINEYVRPHLLLSPTELHTFTNHERIAGIYQIDIFGQLNRGVASVHTLADEIKQHFDSERQLTQGNTILLVQNISMGREAREGSWYKTFLEINFICYN